MSELMKWQIQTQSPGQKLPICQFWVMCSSQGCWAWGEVMSSPFSFFPQQDTGTLPPRAPTLRNTNRKGIQVPDGQKGCKCPLAWQWSCQRGWFSDPSKQEDCGVIYWDRKPRRRSRIRKQRKEFSARHDVSEAWAVSYFIEVLQLIIVIPFTAFHDY